MASKSEFIKFVALTRARGWATLCLALWFLGLGLSAKAQDRKASIITIDAPGAGTSAGQGTSTFAINPAGVITGFLSDADGVRHGLVRAPNGTITTFDVPGAGTEFFQGTRAYSINPAGAVTGWYSDASNVAHGYVRAPGGSITTFDVPDAGGAGTASLPGTFGYNINPAGVIAGYYTDVNFVFHSFVRARDGTITTFDAPGASTSSGQGTFTAQFNGINPAGAVTGNYIDASGVNHGYVRAPGGAITVFDVPGAGNAGPGGINPAGTIVGSYMDASGVNHGFVRAADGTFTTFDIPGAGTAPGEGTLGENINTPGDVDGLYIDASVVFHFFVRSKHGAITKFDAPGTTAGPGTIVGTNNPVGAVTGRYADANGVFHGFLRIP
jgi:hypothetical protein